MATKRRQPSRGIEREVVPSIGQTDAGSIVVEFRPMPPLRSFYGRERQVNVLLYELAAELERRLQAPPADWVVSPEPYRARLVVELGDADDGLAALELVASTLADFGLPLPA